MLAIVTDIAYWITPSEVLAVCTEQTVVAFSLALPNCPKNEQECAVQNVMLSEKKKQMVFCIGILLYIYIYIYIYILRGLKTSDDAFRLSYSTAFDCSIRPFLDLFHSWLYILHLPGSPGRILAINHY